MSVAEERLLLRVPEACERLGVSRSLLYELLYSGQIRYVKIGRATRIPANALTEYVDRLEASGSHE